MFWTLLTAFVAGFVGAGTGLALRHLSGNRLPKGIIPVAAGLAMIVSTIALEYGWYSNVLDTLPADTQVISERTQQAWYQPWTFVNPWVRGFIAHSPSETVETATGSGILAVQIRIHERWQPEVVRPILVDCANTRRADVSPETEFGDDGQPTNASWLELEASDPILQSVCGGGAAD
jgi:hypothetical protein